MAVNARLKINGVVLPSPTSVEISDEILWSSSTGRSSETGEMLGAVKDIKHTLDVEWQWITSEEWATIRDAMPPTKSRPKVGFFSNVVYESTGSSTFVSMDQAYRSNFTRDDGSYVKNKNGTYDHYYKTVKVQIIEK